MSRLLQMPPIHRCPEAAWEPCDLVPRRRNGTYINGPETMDRVAGGVVLAVFVLTLLGFGAWLCKSFSEAETAIIHATGGK